LVYSGLDSDYYSDYTLWWLKEESPTLWELAIWLLLGWCHQNLSFWMNTN